MSAPTPGASKSAPVDLTAALEQVEKSMKQLLASGLTKKAIVLLVANDCGIAQRDVSLVIESAARVASTYLTRRPS